MFYIVEHDMGVHQIIDIRGKANKYGKAKLFNTAGDAMKWLSRHYRESSVSVGCSIYGMGGGPFYEIREATQEEIRRWR